MADKHQTVLVGRKAHYPKSMVFNLDRGDLDHILETLNRGKTWRYSEPLIRLMERLKDCGGNLKRMMEDDPELKESAGKACGISWEPLEIGGAQLVLQQNNDYIAVEPGRVDQMNPERYAAMLFFVWTLNPEWDKLAGPCLRCGQYWLLKTETRTSYCSSRCHRSNSAARSTEEKNKAMHKAQLERVRAKISEWDALKRRPKEDWKRWVSERLPELPENRLEYGDAYHTVPLVKVTPKFITRAINKHELKPPEKEQ